MDLEKYFRNGVDMYKLDSNSFKYVDKKVSWKEALIVVTILSTINAVILLGAQGLGNLIGVPIAVFIFGALFFLFLKIVGAKGGYLDTLKFMCAVGVVSACVSIILAIIQKALSLPAEHSIISLISAIIGIWAFVVSIYAQSYLHKISKLRTFFAMILPVVILVALVALGVTLFFAGAASGISPL